MGWGGAHSTLGIDTAPPEGKTGGNWVPKREREGHGKHTPCISPPRETVDYCKAEISFVIGINQTNHSTNQERPCTTVRQIEKELAICQSLYRPDLVTFPVLSQIKPHTPRLVVSFRQFL